MVRTTIPAIAFFRDKIFVPILIPGIGSQGGSFGDVVNILKESQYPMHMVFINSSSKINYAYLDHPDMDYIEAVFIEIEKMLI